MRNVKASSGQWHAHGEICGSIHRVQNESLCLRLYNLVGEVVYGCQQGRIQSRRKGGGTRVIKRGT